MHGSLCHQRVNVTSVVKRFERSVDGKKKCSLNLFDLILQHLILQQLLKKKCTTS